MDISSFQERKKRIDHLFAILTQKMERLCQMRENGKPHFETVITIEQLNQLLSSHSDVKVIDCRWDYFDAKKARQEYLKEHIPTAVFAELEYELSEKKTEKTGRHPLISAAKFWRLLQTWGIEIGKTQWLFTILIREATQHELGGCFDILLATPKLQS